MSGTYIYATPKPWNLAAFADARRTLPGRWVVVTEPADLTAAVRDVQPRYVFFPHWSFIVPEELTEKVECVCFHMTDVPYGRGGSPLQNLIVRGHTETVLSALQMTQVLDGGPVYAKEPLSLEGSAQDILVRAASTIMQLVRRIVTEQTPPIPQQGEVTAFARRRPEQSRLPLSQASLSTLYDHIRMLDAPGYPKAFLDADGWRLHFDRASYAADDLEARVRFTRTDEAT